MALTQEQVDWWFSQNPDATAEDVAAAVKAVGGLEANQGLAGMIANRYAIAEPEVTNYYNAYTAPTTPVVTTAPTFTDTITAGTPTTNAELLSVLSNNTTTGATTGTTDAKAFVPTVENIVQMPTTRDVERETVEVKGDGRVALGDGRFRLPNGDIIDANGNVVVDPVAEWNAPVPLGDGTFRTPGGTIIDANGYPVTQTVAPADNITNNGYTKPAVAPTSGGVSNVIEGDDIETQIAQLPQEYASWQSSSIPGYIDFIRKSDGAVLDRRQNNTFSDLDLLKIGLSFIPGAGQILAAINVADAARTGNWTQAAIGATGLVPGMQNVNTALRVGQAVDSGNGLGAITALAGNTDVQNLLGLGNVNVGGFTAKDAMTAAQLGSAALAGNTAGVLTSLGTLAGSSDTVLAGRALGLITRIQNGDTRALGEAVNLSNSIAGGGTTGTTGTTGSTTVGNFEDTEVTRLRGLGYTNQQIQDHFNNLENLTDILDTPVSTVVGAAGNDVTLPGGVQLASTGDGVFRTDVGGVPTYAESSNASSVKVPLGYALLSMSESDDKPAGSYYDITANAWFKPDTAVTNLTGDATIQADAALFNNSLGTLDQLDTTRTADEFADFLATLGITNTTQLTDSGLSNQDILDMINALDDTVVVTGGTGNDGITGGTGNDVPTLTVEACKDGKVRDPITGQCVLPTTINDIITGGGGNDDVPTVVVEACKDGKVRDPVTGQCVLPDTIPEVVIEDCKDGKVRDPVTGQCVLPEAIPEVVEACKDGKVRDPITGQCVMPEVVVEACKDGKVRDPVTGLCVLPTQTLDCPEGYEPNEAGTACIPVIKIKDKKCDPGYVYDEDLQKCVPIEDTPCAEGFHLENGLCVPDDDGKCETGYEKVNGTCVPVCQTGYHRDASGACVIDDCPTGYERDEITGKCIPVIEIKSCPTGFVRDEETGKCVPIEDEPCAEGFHRDEATGLCVPDDDKKCETGYEKVDGVCVPVCKEGYIRNLDSGVCEKVEKECPAGQVKDANGKCVPITKTTECQPGYERINGVCVPICQPGYVRIDGVCKKIPTEVTTTMPVSGFAESGEKTDPIYAGGMDSFNLLATLQELLAEEAPKKDDKKSKDKTKMASGGHLDDLLAEQMTVDDLLKLLR
jgi:hypothetical protein